MRSRNAAWIAAVSLIALIVLSTALIRPTAAAKPGGLQANAPADNVISNGWERVFAAPEIEAGVPFHFYAMTWPTRDVGFAVGGADWNAVRPDGLPYNGGIYRTA